MDLTKIDAGRVLKALERLDAHAAENKRYSRSFSAKTIARVLTRDIMTSGEYFRLKEKEQRSIVSKVRRVLHKIENTSGRVRNTSFRDNKHLWRIVTKEQLAEERRKKEELEAKKTKIIKWLESNSIDTEDVEFNEFNITIPLYALTGITDDVHD